MSEARERAIDGSSVAFLCRRLEVNARYAVTDTEISYHSLRDETAETAAARDRLREIATSHAFGGVVMDSRWTLQRYDADFETIAHGLTAAEQNRYDQYRNR